MGRYYSGDIEGKFWFAVQSSEDADFFGVVGSEPNFLNYYFTRDDLPKIKEGIKKCKKELGKYKDKLDEFFKKKDGYNDEQIMKEFGISEKKVKKIIEWYARLILGEKIAKCVEKQGDCEFDAEL